MNPIIKTTFLIGFCAAMTAAASAQTMPSNNTSYSMSGSYTTGGTTSTAPSENIDAYIAQLEATLAGMDEALDAIEAALAELDAGDSYNDGDDGAGDDLGSRDDWRKVIKPGNKCNAGELEDLKNLPGMIAVTQKELNNAIILEGTAQDLLKKAQALLAAEEMKIAKLKAEGKNGDAAKLEVTTLPKLKAKVTEADTNLKKAMAKVAEKNKTLQERNATLTALKVKCANDK